MGGCGMVTALLSATLATHISGAWLKTAFGGLVIASAILMIVNRTRETGQPPRENPWLWAAWALPIGAVTGLLGVGGGTLLMPVMVLGLRFRMHNAVATSLAAIIFTSIGGITGYIINGLGVPGRPSFSAGYVDLPSWFFLAISSVGMTQIGAIAAHKLPERRLVYIFVAVMFYLGLKMLGIFDLLGWPL
jgi:uncharacterized membrane protein YfcA